MLFSHYKEIGEDFYDTKSRPCGAADVQDGQNLLATRYAVQVSLGGGSRESH